MTETKTRDGRRFVLLLYAVIVSLAGLLGFVLGEVVDMGAAPKLFFAIALPPNGLGFAIFGTVTVAVALGVPLVLVSYLSARASGE